MLPLLILIGAYFAGSLPFGLFVARAVKGIDIRDHGSCNIGATNVTRVVGLKWGVVCFLLDVLKGGSPVWLLPKLLQTPNDPSRAHWQVAAGMMAIIGHMFPIWLGFKGGKGVATALGVVAMLAPQSTGITFCVFVVLFAITRIVSLGSIVCAITFAVLQIIQLWPRPFGSETWSLAAFSLAAPVLIIARHRANIGRLLRGEEHRFEFKKRTSPPEKKPDDDRA
ncbi:MAG: glycerol-3-phosphate 1-O-acyltransferase PlsY [Planctomycetia bacterium]|nr:glycerol-3-phosphate 1-O-acyltransferase PlsY [Planctomycetia bacterium]